MITIPSMAVGKWLRPLPELKINLEIPQLRELAGALDRVKVYRRWRAGLCIAVCASVTTQYAFERAVSRGMNKNAGEIDRHHGYLYQYLGVDNVTLEELTVIRQAWASHIARSIYEQIGA